MTKPFSFIFLALVTGPSIGFILGDLHTGLFVGGTVKIL
ncbi:PTS sugar transporter subunit IIC [Enterobacter cloacae complex sp. 339J8]